MPIRPALVAITRIVNARMPTQISAQNASGCTNLLTMPATGSSLYFVARSVTNWCVLGSMCTGNTLMPIVGRNAETNRTAMMTHHVALGTLRPGSLASSARFEIVSMPVYVTIAIEMLARKVP